MVRLARAALSVLVLSLGCAEGTTLDEGASSAGTNGAGGASSGEGGGGGSVSSSSTSASAGAGGAGLVAQSCLPGEFATGVEDGALVCSAIDKLVVDAVNSACSVYLGWADSCGACSTPPTKWGWASAGGCMNGLGNGTCTKPMLGTKTVQLYGLNTGGDVNDDDKFHVGFQCAEGISTTAPGPCAPGALVSGLNGKDVECTPASGAILTYVRESCSLYFGWRDGCGGCTNDPTKWGMVSTLACKNGVGVGDSCSSPMLGPQKVQLFGLSTEGNVNDDDKFYVGLRCEPPKAAGGTAPSACAPGQLVTGIDDTGALICESPAPLVANTFADRCSLYFGWRDSCPSCNLAPSKWGAITQNVCTNDLGAGSTCQTPTLGGSSVKLFGLNTGGDVDDTDKFYVGFRCD